MGKDRGDLPGKAGDSRVTAADNRRFIEAVLWIARTGSPRRDLPTELGNWHSTHTRFNRWCKRGRWQGIMSVLGVDQDLEALMIDGTIVRAHQHAARAQKKAGNQALGRSRGGLSTKIHAAVDALGNPLRCLLSGGQVSDVTHAQALIEGFEADAVLADKGFDANHVLEYLAQRDIEAVIPPKVDRVEQRECDRHACKDRNLVERFFGRLKQFRRIAARYEKLARNFFGMLSLAGVYIWLA